MSSSVVKLLEQRGVRIQDIAEIVLMLQKPYHPDLTLDECVESVLTVLEKREVKHALYTGIALDMLAEQKLLPEPLQSIMERDEPLYGVDEILALAITNVYGSIGLTSFGYLDKEKTGVIAKLNEKGPAIHTFLDDLVAGVAAAASARIAHSKAPDDWETKQNF
ncbi:MAG: phosphatidylglycerophosphatase A [Alicyclobacillaceae bacterium]|nr:phosphatidylglycerophosphatase A [Alicyclobacillaceae bacterium]